MELTPNLRNNAMAIVDEFMANHPAMTVEKGQDIYKYALHRYHRVLTGTNTYRDTTKKEANLSGDSFRKYRAIIEAEQAGVSMSLKTFTHTVPLPR
jgi:hypothetical protein